MAGREWGRRGRDGRRGEVGWELHELNSALTALFSVSLGQICVVCHFSRDDSSGSEGKSRGATWGGLRGAQIRLCPPVPPPARPRATSMRPAYRTYGFTTVFVAGLQHRALLRVGEAAVDKHLSAATARPRRGPVSIRRLPRSTERCLQRWRALWSGNLRRSDAVEGRPASPHVGPQHIPRLRRYTRSLFCYYAATDSVVSGHSHALFVRSHGALTSFSTPRPFWGERWWPMGG